MFIEIGPNLVGPATIVAYGITAALTIYAIAIFGKAFRVDL